jgi:hypothetical protein
MRTGDACQAVAVCNRQCLHAERLGLEQKLFDPAGTTQE